MSLFFDYIAEFFIDKRERERENERNNENFYTRRNFMKKVMLLLMMALLIVPSLFATAYISGTVAPLSFSKATLEEGGVKVSSKEFSMESNLGIQAGYLYALNEKNEIGALLDLDIIQQSKQRLLKELILVILKLQNYY